MVWAVLLQPKKARPKQARLHRLAGRSPEEIPADIPPRLLNESEMMPILMLAPLTL